MIIDENSINYQYIYLGVSDAASLLLANSSIQLLELPRMGDRTYNLVDAPSRFLLIPEGVQPPLRSQGVMGDLSIPCDPRP